jgi:hypothetical protein
MRTAVVASIDAISDAIGDESSDLRAYHADPDIALEDVEFDEVKTVEPSIVAIGDKECTISFYTMLGVRARVEVEVLTNDGPMFVKERVNDEVGMEGTAKLSFPDDGGAALVSALRFDDYEVRMRANPW